MVDNLPTATFAHTTSFLLEAEKQDEYGPQENLSNNSMQSKNEGYIDNNWSL